MPDRMIRASICTSDTLNELSDFEERFWHRLIVNCDDFGRFDARPAILKGSLFPLMDGKTKRDMADALNKLASVGLVELYTVDGKPFLHVVKWSKYQRTRAAKSKFPSPDGACCQLTSDVPVIEDEDESDNRESKTKTTRAREAVNVVVQTSEAVRDFLDRVNPSTPYPMLQELAEFEKALGTAVCKRAFDIALGERKTAWSYVKGILRNCQSRGVRSLADWDRLDAEREKQRGSGRKGGDGSNIFAEMLLEEGGQ